MAPISTDFRSALSDLEKQIQAAQSELLKMPSSRASDCEVEVTSLIPCFDNSESSYYLKIASLYDDQGIEEEGLCLVKHNNDGDFVSSEWVQDLPITTRIAVASRIMELFDIAKEQEGELAKSAREAASEIEQKLAQLRTK